MVKKIAVVLIGLFAFATMAAEAQSLGARDYFLMGSAKYKCNACVQAIEDFAAALNLKKDYHEALYGRSLAYLCIQDYKNALKDIDAAIRLKPDEVLYYECKGRIKTQSGDQKGAIKEYEESLGRDSTVWQAWYGLGLSAHAIKDTVKALNAFNHAILLSPEFALAWFERGRLKQETGQVQQALGDYTKGIELAPGYAPLLEARSNAYLEAGHPEAALEDAKTAINVDIERPMAHFYAGMARKQLGDYTKADADFFYATKLDKRMAIAFYMRGVCHDSLGDYKGARKYFSTAISRDKANKAPYIARAEVWLKELKPQKAIADLSSALKISRDDVDLLLKRGFLYLDVLNYQAAIQDFLQVVKKQPANARAYLGLGISKSGIGNINGACGDLSKAQELGNPDAAAHIQKICVE